MMEVSVHSVLDQTGTTTPCQRFPTKEEFAALQTDGGKLPKNLHFCFSTEVCDFFLGSGLGGN